MQPTGLHLNDSSHVILGANTKSWTVPHTDEDQMPAFQWLLEDRAAESRPIWEKLLSSSGHVHHPALQTRETSISSPLCSYNS